MPTPESPARVLLVEGDDDLHVVDHLRHRSGSMPEFEIVAKNNDSNLLASIRQEIRVPGRVALGILLDADTDVDARWRSVIDRLRTADIIASPTPSPEGAIVEAKPRVGIWLMPDNISLGELENFVERMIPSGDPVWPLSEDYVDGIPEKDRRFPEHKMLRAKVHAWLATRESPRKMGSAIRAMDLDTSGETATKFIAWLRKLFS